MHAHSYLPIALSVTLAVFTSRVAAGQGPQTAGALDHAAVEQRDDSANTGPTACRLAAVPDQPLVRDRHTCLLSSFDPADTSDAEYARVERREVGVGSQPDAPGRFGGGVAVTGSDGCVMYPGLDNYDPRCGTVEFWAQSRGETPIWTDGKEHWLLVLYPERAGASPRHGMAPTFLTLRKTVENTLELRLLSTSAPSYAAATTLRAAQGPTLCVSCDKLAAGDWHHIICSWDLAGAGRMWLLVDAQGVTAPLDLPESRPAPNPGGMILLGGLWGLPGDGVGSSNCNLDDLRVQACTVESRLEGSAPTAATVQLDDARLMAEEDLTRAMLDQLLKLQFHGGWGAAYHWPTYTPTGWGQVGRGVDMWFAHSAEAGQALLRGWLIWGDDRYLDGAIEAADMFCRTQSENGSWAYHYTYSRGEFQRWGDHAYIAQAMQSNQIRFLCLMSRRLGYERYQQAIRKAGDWMASIQFPSGAWGWEAYPLTQWMDTVPEDQRGWLWYDPATNVPVVAYNHEMLPVTHPKAIAEMIPRLDAHYGTKYPWQADRIRDELRRREQGPVYLDWRGWRPCSQFAQPPSAADFAAVFQGDGVADARAQLAAWADGKPLAGGLLGGGPPYGHAFEIGNAIRYCELPRITTRSVSEGTLESASLAHASHLQWGVSEGILDSSSLANASGFDRASAPLFLVRLYRKSAVCSIKTASQTAPGAANQTGPIRTARRT